MPRPLVLLGNRSLPLFGFLLLFALFPIRSLAQSPSITSLSPTFGPAGTSVTITGTNFVATQGTSTVQFNGVAVTPTSWSATSISVAAPSGATPQGYVYVTVGGVTSNGKGFQIGIPPVINTLTPTYGPVGTSVTIAGTNFGATQGTSTVQFNGVSVTPIV